MASLVELCAQLMSYVLLVFPAEVEVMDAETEVENEAMDVELSVREEGQDTSDNLLEDADKQKELSGFLPNQAGNRENEDCQKTTKAIFVLPRSKEELECLIKHIQETVTGNILPKLNRCLIAKVNFWILQYNPSMT